MARKKIKTMTTNREIFLSSPQSNPLAGVHKIRFGKRRKQGSTPGERGIKKKHKKRV